MMPVSNALSGARCLAQKNSQEDDSQLGFMKEFSKCTCYLESIFILIKVNSWSMLKFVSWGSRAFFSTQAISTKTWSYVDTCLTTKKPTLSRSNSPLSSQIRNVYLPGLYM